MYYGGWGEHICRPQGKTLQEVKGSKRCKWPSRCRCHSLSPAPVSPDWFYVLDLPFWYRLTRVVLDQIQKSRKKIVCVCVLNNLPKNESVNNLSMLTMGEHMISQTAKTGCFDGFLVLLRRLAASSSCSLRANSSSSNCIHSHSPIFTCFGILYLKIW